MANRFAAVIGYNSHISPLRCGLFFGSNLPVKPAGKGGPSSRSKRTGSTIRDPRPACHSQNLSKTGPWSSDLGRARPDLPPIWPLLIDCGYRSLAPGARPQVRDPWPLAPGPPANRGIARSLAPAARGAIRRRRRARGLRVLVQVLRKQYGVKTNQNP